MKVLFSVWGNPCNWEEVTYEYKGSERQSFTTVEVLDAVENFDKIVIFVFDSLIAEVPYCRNCPTARAKVAPRGYGKLRDEVLEMVERWIRNKTRIDISKVTIRVLPNVGRYRDGWNFILSTLTPFDLAGSFMLNYLFKEIGDTNFFDLSHGINYAPTLLRELGLLATMMGSLNKYKEIKGVFLNSEPYAPKATLKIHVVDEVEVSPKTAAKEVFFWIIKYRNLVFNKLRVIKFSGMPPQALKEINEEAERVGEYLKAIAGAFRISAPLALAMLSKRGVSIRDPFEELLKFVKVSGKRITWNYVPTLDGIIFLYSLMSLANFVRTSASEVGKCEVNGYGVCLRKLIERVGGLQEDVAIHELDNLLRKDFSELVGNCKDADLRNFIAHAGLEKNVVKVIRGEESCELAYCDQDMVEDLLRNVLKSFV